MVFGRMDLLSAIYIVSAKYDMGREPSAQFASLNIAVS